MILETSGLFSLSACLECLFHSSNTVFPSKNKRGYHFPYEKSGCNPFHLTETLGFPYNWTKQFKTISNPPSHPTPPAPPLDTIFINNGGDSNKRCLSNTMRDFDCPTGTLEDPPVFFRWHPCKNTYLSACTIPEIFHISQKKIQSLPIPGKTSRFRENFLFHPPNWYKPIGHPRVSWQAKERLACHNRPLGSTFLLYRFCGRAWLFLMFSAPFYPNDDTLLVRLLDLGNYNL